MMKPYQRKILYGVLVIFILMNAVAAYHAYKFTHFSAPGKRKTHNPEKLGFFEKIGVLIKGVDNPRPENDSIPGQKFEEIQLHGHDGNISCWFIPKIHPQGTIILFHGYTGNKSKLILPARVFDSLGYQTMLVDFEGSGASADKRTTIGYYEADDVAAAYRYCLTRDGNIILYGSSMGASAIIRAISLYHIKPGKCILECPYGSMLDAAINRFKIMGVSSFPMAYLLVFWGGIENGYWAFSQDCTRYAKDIHCPVLLMRGLDDKNVTQKEVSDIYHNLSGPKKLHQFFNTGHESYCAKDHQEWVGEVEGFLSKN